MKSKWFITLLVIALTVLIEQIISFRSTENQKAFNFSRAKHPADTVWRGWNHSRIPINSDGGKLIQYGYQLIANTSVYLGPKGTVAHISNGMNCQNCHLDGGTVPYGDNFGKVYATYPLFSARRNGIQSIYGRVNDCFERSLNGTALDSNSNEMQAIYAYIKWLGNYIPKGHIIAGTGTMKLKIMNIAADSSKGKEVYLTNCSSCHGKDGEGVLNADKWGYVYPPLWGRHSYNDGAGIYRIGSFAGFVKNNMPFGTNYRRPKLSDKEAWDVAAFVNSQPRPHKNQSADWKNLKMKPIDFPFGPYADTFPEKQHKYGPFKAVKDADERNNIQ